MGSALPGCRPLAILLTAALPAGVALPVHCVLSFMRLPAAHEPHVVHAKKGIGAQ